MMNTIWLHIIELAMLIKSGLDTLFYPLNTIHPALTITFLAWFTVYLTSRFRNNFSTRRYRHMKEEFDYWHNVRLQALDSFQDNSRGRQMAKNIDQAKLNKIYYDYFFEGLLNNLLTTYLPIMLAALYINESFKPEHLQQMTGQRGLFSFSGEIQIGALPWFVLCLVAIRFGWFLLNKTIPVDTSQSPSVT